MRGMSFIPFFFPPSSSRTINTLLSDEIDEFHKTGTEALSRMTAELNKLSMLVEQILLKGDNVGEGESQGDQTIESLATPH